MIEKIFLQKNLKNIAVANKIRVEILYAFIFYTYFCYKSF